MHANLAEWLTAAGTIGAAFVAVGFGAVAPWWRRPKLVVVAQDQRAKIEISERADVMWIRIPISNGNVEGRRWRRYRDAAIEVEGLLLSLEVGPDGARSSRQVGGLPLSWTATGERTTTIPAGSYKYLDLATLEGRNYTERLTSELSLTLDNPPGDRRHIWTDPIAVISLVVVARNSRPTTVRLQINLEGLAARVTVLGR
jgi:hypothetical protein